MTCACGVLLEASARRKTFCPTLPSGGAKPLWLNCVLVGVEGRARRMVSTAYLICIAGLLGSLGHCDNSYICKAQDRLQEAPQARVWKGRGGHFRPFTFCKSTPVASRTLAAA